MSVPCLHGPQHIRPVGRLRPYEPRAGDRQLHQAGRRSRQERLHHLQSFQETVKIYEQGKRYYDALKSVSNLVRSARKVQQCILLVGEISDIYVDGYRRMVGDENFTPAELAAIAAGYARIIEESAGELKELQDIVNPTDMSLTDKDRIDVVQRVYGVLRRHRDLARYYTRKNISISLLRAARKRDMEGVLSLYGTDEQRYW